MRRFRCEVWVATLSVLFIISDVQLLQTSLPPPSSLLLQVFNPLLNELHSCSARCTFLVYTVSIIGPKSESHHFSVQNPAHVHEGCAVFILLENVNDKSVFEENKILSLTDELQAAGWYVVAQTINIPQVLNRRMSRYPKLNPGYFFPRSEITLYYDVKLSTYLQHTDAHKLALILLRDGASFGIVQHEKSESLAHEIERIELASSKRPLLDSQGALELQWLKLSSGLNSNEQKHAGVEGRLKASRIKGRSSARMFEEVWLDEFMAGTDRDQIAFYGAFARMQMELEYKFECKKYARAGFYQSTYAPQFSLNIHCSFSKLLLMSAMNSSVS